MGRADDVKLLGQARRLFGSPDQDSKPGKPLKIRGKEFRSAQEDPEIEQLLSDAVAQEERLEREQRITAEPQQ